jgi:serine/threonine-protein kinase
MSDASAIPTFPSRERWQALEPLLDTALSLSIDQRERFLDQTCVTDPALREELERMLAACDRLARVDPLLSRPAVERFASLWDEPGELRWLESELADRYRFEGETGRGGMAVVYRARDLRHGRSVAVKVLRGTPGERGTARFRREIALAANLQHPHIVPVFDSGESGGRLWYTMPFVEGESLGRRLRREGRLEIPEAVRVVREIADALAYAHARGVVHRDLKPDNVLLSGGHAVIADLGIAKAVGDSATAGIETSQQGTATSVTFDSRLPTLDSLHAGTPAFMAPEQIVADAVVDHRADLYALGVIAYQLLAGVPPFVGTSRHALFDAHLTEKPVPLSRHRGDVSPALERLVMQLLEKRADDRPRSAADVLAALDEIAVAPLSTQSGAAAGSHPPRPRRSWRRRWLVAAATSVVVAGSSATWIQARRSTPPMRRVLVLPLENESGDTSLASLGTEAARWIADDLSRSEFVTIVSDIGTQPAAITRDIAAAAAERQARLVVTGQYSIAGDSIGAQIQIHDVVTRTRLPGSKRVFAPRSSPATLLARLADEALVMLATRLDPRMAEWSMGAAPQSMDAYRTFLDGLDENARGNHEDAIAQWARAADMDTTFMQPLLHAAAMLAGPAPARADSFLKRVERRRSALTAGDRAWLAAIRANTDGNTVGFYQSSQDILRAEPGTQLPYFFIGIGAVRLNRPNTALDAAKHIEYRTGRFRLQWTNEVYSFVVTEAYHQLGRHGEELAFTREVRNLNPENRNLVAETLRALAALGQVGSMDSVLTKLETMPPTPYGPPLATQLLAIAGELAFHGHAEDGMRLLERALEWQRGHPREVPPSGNARFELARTLYFLRRYADAAPLLDSLVRAEPTNPFFLAYAAVNATRTGDSSASTVLRSRLDTLTRSFDHGQTLYARALVAAQLGDTAAAVIHLEASLGQGMPPDGMAIHADLMLSPLWTNARFRELLRPRD